MGDTLCDVSRQTKPWGESNPGYPFVVRHRVVYKKGKRIDYCVALYKGAFRLPWEPAPCIPVSAHRFAGWRQNTGKILLQFVFLLGRHSLPLEVSKSIIDLALEFDVSAFDDRFDELFDFELGSPIYRDPRLAFKE